MTDLAAQPRAIEVITDDTTCAHLAIKLAAECHRAKRCVPVGRRFDTEMPTAYDLAHDRLNALITDHQRRAILDALGGS